jgi:L,D-peptidoglycan transpeptidase YkuD (ErfK/YbiS/YcfS/YnhG family)
MTNTRTERHKRVIIRTTVDLVIVKRRPGAPARGLLRAGTLVVPCALGRGGVVSSKREGDGGTPMGRFALRRLWWRAGRVLRPRCGLPMRQTKPQDGWCDAPAHPRYNRPVTLPFAPSHETMWREDHLYDVVIEIGWNDLPARRGRGSAIFLHLARPGYSPTEGCVAVSRAALLKLLPLIGRHTRIEIT